MAENASAAEPALLQGRIEALSALTKCLLTAMVVHGSLTKEEALDLLDEAGGMLPNGNARAAARAELAQLAADLPDRLRAAAYPRIPGDLPDQDDH